MRKKPTVTVDNIILADKLILDEWLALIGTEKWDYVHPTNCFPTDLHKQEYIARLSSFTDKEIRTLLRQFLNKTGYYGVDEGRFTWVVKTYGADAVFDDTLPTEFDRRSIPKNGPQWEGVTWALDLLPRNPLEAIAAIRAYVHAHALHFTDYMFYGHNDVVDVIQARYRVAARYSCFISYGTPDEAFARMLYDSLTERGVQAFFFPVHAVPGKKLHKVMREGVNQYDRTILICSKASLNRSGVLNELNETLQREAREGGKDYLIPIKLDDYVFSDWAPDDPQLAQAVRDRVVADFSGTRKNKTKYNQALLRLISALEQPFPG